MKKLPPARFNFTIEDENYALIKNKTVTDTERMEILAGTTHYFLTSARYFKIKAHIIAITNQFEQEEVLNEKLTLLANGLTHRLKEK